MKTLFIKYCQNASPFINYGTLGTLMITSLWLNTEWNIIHWLVLFPLGMITWSFLEYAFHRFIFHFTSRHGWIKNLVYYIHGIHHHYNKTTNYVPFLQNLLFYGGGLMVCYLIMGSYTFIFYSGFMVAVIYQVYIHNLVHQTKSKYFKKLQYHHQYHHSHPGYNFGISSRFWDKVFGTSH